MFKPKKKPRGKPFQKGHDPRRVIQFMPGQSGNPKGDSEGYSIRAALRKILREPEDQETAKGTKAEAVARAQIELATKKKNTLAAGFVTENAEGKQLQPYRNETLPDVEEIIKRNDELIKRHRKQK